MQTTEWKPIETIPQDTAVLVYGFGYEVAHFNTQMGKLVSCWDHRPIKDVTHWSPLPEAPQSTRKEDEAPQDQTTRCLAIRAPRPQRRADMNQKQDELIKGLNMIADAIEHGALLPPGMVDTVRRGAAEIEELYHTLKFERETNDTVMNQNADLTTRAAGRVMAVVAQFESKGEFDWTDFEDAVRDALSPIRQ